MPSLQDLPLLASPLDAVRPAPSAWRDRLQGYVWHAQTIGCSDADVFHLTGEGRRSLFVKAEPLRPLSELPGEIERLRWLSSQSELGPTVEAEVHEAGRIWVLMSEIPGRDLASSPDLAPHQIVEIAADALRQLHSLDIAACPFDQRLATKLAQVEANVAAGLVDEEDMDDERLGRNAVSVLEEALASRPSTEDLVVAHGDASMPNLMAADGRFTGFIDCGRLGVADRHQDLAIASWSIESNFGASFVGPFLARYGGEVDPARLHYYRLLDELF